MKATRTVLLVVLVVGLVGLATARASTPGKAGDWKKVMAKAKISLVDAIQKAQKETGGQAIGAEVELEGGKVIMDVLILTKGEKPKILEVEVNGETGAIIETEEEDDDDDDDDDDEDDDGDEDDEEDDEEDDDD